MRVSESMTNHMMKSRDRMLRDVTTHFLYFHMMKSRDHMLRDVTCDVTNLILVGFFLAQQPGNMSSYLFLTFGPLHISIVILSSIYY